MVLKENIYELINNTQTRLALAMELNCTEQTIKNYIATKSEQLTLASALKVIKLRTGLKESQLLTEEKAIA